MDFLKKAVQNVVYNTHGQWSTLGEIFKVEVEERGNSTLSEVPKEWIERNKDLPAIWVCFSPVLAHRYNVEVEYMECSLEELNRLFPNAIEEVEEIKLTDHMLIIDEDGDEGYLIVDFGKYANEKFDWFIELLREGKKVSINPYDYGDFLRYVSALRLEKEFDKMRRVNRETDDELFPVVVDIWFEDQKENANV